MGYDTFTKCFFSCAARITEYGSEVWGFTTHPKLETVQQKAMRVFLGVHRFAANDFLYGDMGWYPTKTRLKLNLLRYWNRLCTLDDNRLTKKVFLLDLEQEGKWTKSVGKILEELDMHNLFEERNVCIIDECKISLQTKYMQDWRELVCKKPKLRSYVQ